MSVQKAQEIGSVIITILLWLSVVAFATCSAASVADIEAITPANGALRDCLVFLKNTAWIILPVTGFASAVLDRIKRWLKSQRVKRALQAALDALVTLAFGVNHKPTDRATLFKRRPFKLRPLRWRCLVKYARSGHMNRKTRAVFSIPDDSDLVEGVAGQSYAEGMIRVPYPDEDPLPDPFSGTSEEIEDYARRTFVTPGFIKEHNTKSRSFCAFRVTVGGNEWGVVVLDSQKPDVIGQKKGREFETIARIMGELLVD